MAQLKVLISGAGVAGPSLAFWLSKLGHDVTVIERFPDLRATGLQIDLRGHGIEVMKRTGLEQEFRSKSIPEHGIQIVDKSGRRRAYFPAEKSGKGAQSFTSEFEIMRGDLCRLLYNATKDRVKYIFGTSIESFEENDSSVEVRFTDGKTDCFDLLVGADGQGSRTRKMMLGLDTPDALIPIGSDYVAYSIIPWPIQEGEEYIATMFMAPGRGTMIRRHSPDEIQVLFNCNSGAERLSGVRRGDVKEEKNAFVDIYRGAGWQVDEILKSVEASNDFYCERMGLVKLESWSRGRVTLVGDAGYCPSAYTGMGTTSAIVGAYILAGEIGRHCGCPSKKGSTVGDNSKDSLTAALNSYEQKFRPFMDQVQKGVGDGHGWDRFLSTPFGIALLTWVMGAASLFKVNIFKYILKENVKDWDLPDYKEMLQS